MLSNVNFKNLSVEEQKDVNGGILPFIAGFAVGAIITIGAAVLMSGDDEEPATEEEC